MRRNDLMDPFDTFRLLLDEYSSKIVQLTSPRALNAIQLSDELGIPIAACYRRIRALKDAGVLREESRVISIGGKMVATYRSVVESAEVMLQDGRLKVLIKAAGASNADEVMLSEEPSMLVWAPRKQ